MTLFDMTVGGSGSGGGGKCLDPSNIYVGADLTLENGIVSGFSKKTRYYTNNAKSQAVIATGVIGFYDIFPLNTANSWEFKTKIKIEGYASESLQFLLTAYDPANNYYCPKIQLNNLTQTFRIAVSFDGKTWGVLENGIQQLNVGEWYYIKLVFTGSEYKLQISQDDVNYVDDIAVSSTEKSYVDKSHSYWAIGFDPNDFQNASRYFNGSVDLTKTTVTINEEEVFKAL